MSTVNKLICEFCNTEGTWEANCRKELWHCERCGRKFCTSCSKKKFTRPIVCANMHIACPECETYLETIRKVENNG